MIVFEITVNGKPCETADDITALTLVAEQVARRNADRVTLVLGGAADEQVHSLDAHLKAGDEILIRIVEVTEQAGDEDEPTTCSFCGAMMHDVTQPVRSAGASICETCTRAFAAVVNQPATLPMGAMIRDVGDFACGFCSRTPGDVPGVIVRNGAAICPECLRACADMIEGRPFDGD